MRLLTVGLLALTLSACDSYADDGYDAPAVQNTPPAPPPTGDGDYLTGGPGSASAGTTNARVSGRPLSATLTGEAEVGPGDLDGSGTALVRLNSGLERV